MGNVTLIGMGGKFRVLMWAMRFVSVEAGVMGSLVGDSSGLGGHRCKAKDVASPTREN